jgi:hypothetical protein
LQNYLLFSSNALGDAMGVFKNHNNFQNLHLYVEISVEKKRKKALKFVLSSTFCHENYLFLHRKTQKCCGTSSRIKMSVREVGDRVRPTAAAEKFQSRQFTFTFCERYR